MPHKGPPNLHTPLGGGRQSPNLPSAAAAAANMAGPINPPYAAQRQPPNQPPNQPPPPPQHPYGYKPPLLPPPPSSQSNPFPSAGVMARPSSSVGGPPSGAPAYLHRPFTGPAAASASVSASASSSHSYGYKPPHFSPYTLQHQHQHQHQYQHQYQHQQPPPQYQHQQPQLQLQPQPQPQPQPQHRGPPPPPAVAPGSRLGLGPGSGGPPDPPHRQGGGKGVPYPHPSMTFPSGGSAVTTKAVSGKGIPVPRGPAVAQPPQPPPHPPPHQGKKPPSVAVKKKRGRGRPPGSGAGRGLGGDGKRRASSSSSSSKVRRQQQQPRRLGPSPRRSSLSGGAGTSSSRRSSGGGGSRSNSNTGPKIRLLDEAPDRLINPLLEIPAEAAIPNNEPPMQGSELLTMADLVFYRPDTYPLSYLGRLLGFDIPVPQLHHDHEYEYDHDEKKEEENEKGGDGGGGGSSSTSISHQQHYHFPTPLPDVATLSLRRRRRTKSEHDDDDRNNGNAAPQDVFLQIPPAGPRFRNILERRPQKQKQNTATLGDEDDQMTLGRQQIDPVYAYLLQAGFQRSRCKPGAASLVAKLVAPLKTTTLAQTRQAVVEMARTLESGQSHNNNNNNNNKIDDWTFGDWSSVTTAHPTQRPRWTLDDHRVIFQPPSQSFGVVALYQGHPIAVLHYKFQWYPMSTESELVLVLEGFGQRTGTEVILETVPTAPTAPTAPVVAAAAATATTVEGTGETTASGTGIEPLTAPGTKGSKMTEAPPTITGDESNGVAPSSLIVQQEGGLLTNHATSAIAAAATTMSPPPKAPPAPLPNVPTVELSDHVRLMMITLALEHARAVDVWYGLWNAPKSLFELNRRCFRMVPLPLSASLSSRNATSTVNQEETTVPMICDLKKCNARYALLKQKEYLRHESEMSTAAVASQLSASQPPPKTTRYLIKMPTFEEAKCCFDESFAEMQRSKRTLASGEARVFTSATGPARGVTVGIRATLKCDSSTKVTMELKALQEDMTVGAEIDLSSCDTGTNRISKLPNLEILRSFPLATPTGKTDEGAKEDDDEILKELKAKQAALLAAESGLEPRLRALMVRAVEERREYEQPEARQKRGEEKYILQRHDQNVAHRKQMDQAWQEQLEQDMNAVCNICNDGEVTPDNQILFCEACNVPVHQMCYGIDEVPEGDYYCVACRFFGREKMSQELAKRSGDGPRISLPPLPIHCELCPIKKGAYIRSDTSKSAPNSTISKWCHMACAKWQGLNFVVEGKPELVEDVTELKKYFRRLDYSCAVCQGQRGAYQNCRFEGCGKWLHITCARAIGICEVIHGENFEGPVALNPWTLMCPEHSDVDTESFTKDPMPVEQLIQIGKEFLDEPMPEPLPQAHKPFNKQNGKERRLALADSKYEREFLDELIKKRFAGMRCGVCHTIEEDGKHLARCTGCEFVICISCRFSDEEIVPEKKYFKCFACRYIDQKEKAKEEYKTPQCQLCNQKQGLLLESFAKPVNRLGHWKNNDKEFKRSIFARKLWTHYACAFWIKGLEVDGQSCKVNCSNVVMSNGRAYIKASNKCALCGLSTGMKSSCADSNCRANGERRMRYHFHISCARQAGYEVQHEDDNEPPFFVKCYFHSECEYNLRARLEDLIEVEKKRAGKKLTRAEGPMTFHDGSRLLNHAIEVMRILGWAWRWAEHWVESGSTWEPLLEPGQKERNMTKKQLKIVDSSPESRADDARLCRLAAFGAALRDRAYDTVDGFDNESLGRALNAILRTCSLVGPLKYYEVNFFIDWLCRAYRSKSKLLGFGEDKIRVATDGFCVHSVDKSPKFALGGRPVPGKAPFKPDQVFEDKVEEPDDFLLPEFLSDGSKSMLPPNCLKLVKKKAPKYKKSSSENDDESDLEEPAKLGTPARPQKPQKRKQEEGLTISEIQRRKLAKPSKSAQEAPLSVSKADSVAAMVPSAVKKRGQRLSSIRCWIPVTDPPSLMKKKAVPAMAKKVISDLREKGLPLMDTLVEYAELLSRPQEDSVLRKIGRRGRPPKILEFGTYVIVDGKYFNPQVDKEDKNAGTTAEDDQVTVKINKTGRTPQSATIEFTADEDAEVGRMEVFSEKNVPDGVKQDATEDDVSNHLLGTPKERTTANVVATANLEPVESEKTVENEKSSTRKRCRPSADTSLATKPRNEDPVENPGGADSPKVESTALDLPVDDPKPAEDDHHRPKRKRGRSSSNVLLPTEVKEEQPDKMATSIIESSAAKREKDTVASRKRSRSQLPTKAQTKKHADISGSANTAHLKLKADKMKVAVAVDDTTKRPKSRPLRKRTLAGSYVFRPGDIDGGRRRQQSRRSAAPETSTDIPEEDDGGKRRSSRYSLAKEISLKEPGDNFSDVDEDVAIELELTTPKKRYRQLSPHSSPKKGHPKERALPPVKRGRGQPPTKKQEQAESEDEESIEAEDDSFQPTDGLGSEKEESDDEGDVARKTIAASLRPGHPPRKRHISAADSDGHTATSQKGGKEEESENEELLMPLIKSTHKRRPKSAEKIQKAKVKEITPPSKDEDEPREEMTSKETGAASVIPGGPTDTDRPKTKTNRSDKETETMENTPDEGDTGIDSNSTPDTGPHDLGPAIPRRRGRSREEH